MSALDDLPGTAILALDGARDELTTAIENKDLESARANVKTALKYVEMVLQIAREAQNEVDQRIAPS